MPVENEARRLTGIERDLADQRPTDELIETALAEAELDDDEWPNSTRALSCLLARGNHEGFEAAYALSRSDDPQKRDLAATIFGQLGTPERTFPDECCDALLDLLARETDSQVFVTTVFAFGHLGDRRAEPALIALRQHPNEVVRHGVAFSLAGTETPEGIRTLLELMDDPYAVARDWATTGVRMVPSIDGPEIRAALNRRINDNDELTRIEALRGLAARHDEHVVPHLLSGLMQAADYVSLYEDAAKAYLGIEEWDRVETSAIIQALTANSQGF